MSTALSLQQPIRAPLGAIAKAFLTVSVFGFGGGIVLARRIAVEQRGWLSDAEFLDIVSLCQFLPATAPSASSPLVQTAGLPSPCKLLFTLASKLEDLEL